MSDVPSETDHLCVSGMFGKIICIIIHQIHYEKSDWSRAFNQFTIACELDMINAISAADIAFTMSSSAWLLSPHDIVNYQNLVSVLSASTFDFGR